MKYFKEEEFNCKCCGKNNMDYQTKLMLDTARELAGVPFIINSACRCSEHNAKVGGSATSSHLKGIAVDIKAIGSRDRYLIYKGLLEAGFKRIGVANSFIHADNDTTKSQDVMWLY